MRRRGPGFRGIRWVGEAGFWLCAPMGIDARAPVGRGGATVVTVHECKRLCDRASRRHQRRAAA